ncbi:hypothetical protein L596_022521 [Steinernema carpocapsae]|uniref:SH2 domain-containing protein n=1 Tax=Steinernema carpocapsae TaxID=34508 RepID=A0A4U5MLW6_STECR|nr:hypothetical protein L596_022521 [Steinernema carpocapsae]
MSRHNSSSRSALPPASFLRSSHLRSGRNPANRPPSEAAMNYTERICCRHGRRCEIGMKLESQKKTPRQPGSESSVEPDSALYARKEPEKRSLWSLNDCSRSSYFASDQEERKSMAEGVSEDEEEKRNRNAAQLNIKSASPFWRTENGLAEALLIEAKMEEICVKIEGSEKRKKRLILYQYWSKGLKRGKDHKKKRIREQHGKKLPKDEFLTPHKNQYRLESKPSKSPSEAKSTGGKYYLGAIEPLEAEKLCSDRNSFRFYHCISVPRKTIRFIYNTVPSTLLLNLVYKNEQGQFRHYVVEKQTDEDAKATWKVQMEGKKPKKFESFNKLIAFYDQCPKELECEEPEE